MSNWFFMVGEPLAEAERAQVQNYLLGLGIRDAFSIDSVSDWSGVRDLIDRPDWDRRWWEAEQVERQRLYARAVAARGESAARDALSSERTRRLLRPRVDSRSGRRGQRVALPGHARALGRGE
jgi:hypothetical protein